MTDLEKIVRILGDEALECGDGGIYDPAGCARRILAALTAPPRPDHAGGVSLSEACEPWKHHVGDPPRDDSPLFAVFGAGIDYTERHLAELLGVSIYEGGDGSEDFRTDAGKTLLNILDAAGLYDRDEGVFAKLTPAQAPDKAAEREGVAPMPATTDREPYDAENPAFDGYLESNVDWARTNDEAVGWLADNHRAIRAALATKPTGTEAGRSVGAETDLAASVAETVKVTGGWWKSCSGCHETSEGCETGHYPYSAIFQCHAGSGCSECGGLGVRWEHYTEADFAAMAADLATPTPPTPDSTAQGDGTSQEGGQDDGARERVRVVLAEWFSDAEGMCRAYEGDLPDTAEIYVVAAKRSRLYLGTYGELRRAALDPIFAGNEVGRSMIAEKADTISDEVYEIGKAHGYANGVHDAARRIFIDDDYFSSAFQDPYCPGPEVMLERIASHIGAMPVGTEAFHRDQTEGDVPGDATPVPADREGGRS